MSRSRARHTAITPPLFPFLAVLLCTLGVLVMLLTVMASVQHESARQKQQAAIHPATAPSPEQQHLQQLIEQVQRQKEISLANRQQADQRAQLAAGRLSRVEQSLREQQLRLEKLRLGIEELARLDREHHTELEEAKERLAALRERIADRQDELRTRREETSTRPKSYAILPYDGPNGTKRRPVYIECLEDRVVIQPEGIELGPADFNLQLGQGTPLAAALRAARDYYTKIDTHNREQAYPLILVRPEGVGSYLAVMATLEMWESDYGYEMVASDWRLDCGTANPQLTQELQLAVANARTAAVARAARAPLAFREGSLDSFATAPGLLESLQAAPPSLNGPVDYDDLIATMATGRGGNGGIDPNRIAAALAQAQDGTGGPNGVGGIGGEGGGSRDENAPGQPGATDAGLSGIPPEQQGPGRGFATQGEAGGTQSAVADAEGMPGPAGGEPGAMGEPGATPGNLMAMNSGNGMPAPPTATPSGEKSSAQPVPTVVVGNSQVPSDSASQEGGSPAARDAQALAKGLMVERPIRVELKTDRIIVGRNPHVRGHNPRDAGRSVMLDNGPRETSEAFSRAIREHVADWGIAGSDSQWKPVLILYVEPGSEALAQQLTAALRDSGVEVRLPDTARR